MLTSVDPRGTRLGLESTLYSALLLVTSMVLVATGLIDWVYGVGALALGTVMVVLGGRLWRVREDRRAWHLFFGSILYLPALLVLMLVDRFFL